MLLDKDYCDLRRVPHCKGMAIGVARRGARRSGECTLRIPPSCSFRVSHACGPRVASFVRRSSVCGLANVRARGRAWRAARCEASRKKERPAKKRVGTLKKKRKTPCVLRDHCEQWERRARSFMKERSAACVRWYKEDGGERERRVWHWQETKARALGVHLRTW